MTTFEEIILSNGTPLAPLPTGAVEKLNKLVCIKAVVFDVYGTLMVSGSGDVGTAAATNTAEALTQALGNSGFTGELEQAGRMGKDMLKAEILKSHQASRNAGVDFPEVEITEIWKTITDALVQTGVVESREIEADRIHRLALEYECFVNPVYPMPGSAQIIESLNDKGITLGIVSNAQFYTPLLFPAFFQKTIEELGFDPECCIWSYAERKAKPSADLFPQLGTFLEKNHGIGLSETLYVGNDMLNDVYCAQIAGCKTALFAGDKRSLRMRENDERCATRVPDAVITDLKQIAEII